MERLQFKQISTTNGTIERPCDLVKMYIDHESESDTNTIYSFLSLFSFSARDEVAGAVRTLAKAIAGDKWVQSKDRQRENILIKSIYTRYNDIVCKIDKFNKYPNAIAGELWHGGYCRDILEARTTNFYTGVTPDKNIFVETCNRIKQIYNLSDNDINKLHFFVEQVKAGASFPNSLRRMLYIWGVAKMTGKTTSATMLVTLLNGDTNEKNISKYSTSLSNEMQIGSFKVPLISECNVCLMDECFYADMGKTYADFKRFITSSNGTARLPYGQTFEWQGQPNYIATSNDSLQRFIKDWDDRRYLAVEFTGKPTQELTFDEIKSIWRAFVLHSTREKDWKQWADELAPVADEIGERQERANEFAIEMQQKEFIDYICAFELLSDSPANSANKISLKKFVDYFARAIGTNEAHKRRAEIETAVIQVFGERYSKTNYWLLSNLQKKAIELKSSLYKSALDLAVEKENEKLPF